MLVAVCSDKGSPGATTTAVALAAAWPMPTFSAVSAVSAVSTVSPVLVVEADPYGGDLAIRIRAETGAALPEAPTVLTAATAARTHLPASQPGHRAGTLGAGHPAPQHASDPTSPPDSHSGGQRGSWAGLVGRYAHRVNAQMSVLPGHLVAEQTTGVTTWEPFADALAASAASSGQVVSGVPVIVDVGRLHAASPVLGVAARADVVVVVSRPDPVSVIRLRERLTRLVGALAAYRGSAPRLFPVLVCPARHGRADVADLRRVLADTPAGPLLAGVGFVALDPGAVARVEAGENPAGRLARTPLLRTARTVATDLGALVAEPPAADPVPTPAAAPVRAPSPVTGVPVADGGDGR